MIDSGLRPSEVTGLRATDLDIEGEMLKVMGKGHKEGVVPIGSATQKALWRYANHSRPDPIATDRFFLTLDGTGMSGAFNRGCDLTERLPGTQPCRQDRRQSACWRDLSHAKLRRRLR